MEKTETLKKNYEFKYVLTKGVFYPGMYINIYILKGNQPVNRIGIAVQKKIATAVKRNKIKRVIRASYTLIEKDINQCCNIVIVCKKNIKIQEATFANINKDMLNILKRAGVLNI